MNIELNERQASIVKALIISYLEDSKGTQELESDQVEMRILSNSIRREEERLSPELKYNSLCECCGMFRNFCANENIIK